MQRFAIVSVLVSTLALSLLTGCSSDVSTNALATAYGDITVTFKKGKENEKPGISADMKIVLTNRTERAMNIGFQEGTIVDAQTNLAVARFRPIVPDSYGAMSTIQLFPRQTREIPVVTPLDLESFETNIPSQVIVKLFLITEGYRTEAVSAPVPVAAK